MAQPFSKPADDLDTETPEQRDERLTWERARITEAEEDFAAGRYLQGEEAEVWLARELAEAQSVFDRESD